MFIDNVFVCVQDTAFTVCSAASVSDSVVFQNRHHNVQKDYMTCCPTNKVIKYCTELLAM